MRSMTGFGRASCSVRGRELTAEVRSLNGKFLDLSFRLPPRWERLEGMLAKAVRAKAARGKVVVTLYWGNGGVPGMAFSRPLYRACARELRLVCPGPVTREAVLGVAGEGSVGSVSAEGLADVCVRVVEQAMDHLVQVREAEGREIRFEISSQLDLVEARIADIESLLPEVAHDTQKRLEAALGRLGQAGAEVAADRERVSREVALLLVRSDAREETVRVRAHVAACKERVAAPGPHGKMLEFLLQEMQRELNTLGAKTTHLEVSRLTLEARAAVDQMREQVANVE